MLYRYRLLLKVEEKSYNDFYHYQVRAYCNTPLQISKIWFPIVSQWLKLYFEPEKIIDLAIDRTNWKGVNLFIVSVIWDRRSFPIYFELLRKAGNSNFGEQKEILSQVLPLFSNYKISILGDREFCSIHLANWLSEQQVGAYCNTPLLFTSQKKPFR